MASSSSPFLSAAYNRTQQLEELEALRSIYEPAVLQEHVAAVGDTDPRTTSLTLQLAPALAGAAVRITTGARAHIVHVLPPVVVHIALPLTYPARPPRFRLEAPFAPVRRLAALADELAGLFVSGEPVIFSWAQHVLSESLDLLLERTSVLKDGADGAQGTGTLDNVGDAEGLAPSYVIDLDALEADTSTSDKRCARSAQSARELLTHLISYARSVDARELAEGYFRCSSCWETLAGTECVMLRGCRHVSCRACACGFWEARINEGRVGERDVVCLEASCGRAAEADEVLAAVGAEAAVRYEDLLLSRALDRDEGSMQCPRRSCGRVAFLDGRLGRCAYCALRFCVDCGRGWHGDGECHTATEESAQEVLELWQRGGAEALEEARERVPKHVMERVETGVLLASMGGKTCPQCGMLVVKNGGCQHMRCVCGANFCWQCGVMLFSVMQHYRSGECVLFEDVSLQRAQEEIWEWFNNIDDD